MNPRILAALAVACIATPVMARSVAHAKPVHVKPAHAEPFGPPCALPSAVMRQIDDAALMLG